MRRASLALCVLLTAGLGFSSVVMSTAGCSRSSSSSSQGRVDENAVGVASITAAEVETRDNINGTIPTFIEEDPMLTRRVEEAISADPYESQIAKNVEVTVEDGVATLRGTVADKEYRQLVQRTVINVPGIAGAHNEIEVAMARDLDDQESDDRIAFELQRSLASLPTVGDDAARVSIDVVHGRIILRGKTRYVTTREEIERIASRTPGVAAVTNDLAVSQD